MKHRTLFFLFAGLLLFFVIVQFPLWFLVASRHSNRLDLRSVQQASILQEPPQEQRSKRDDATKLEKLGKPAGGRSTSYRMSNEAGVLLHSPPSTTLGITRQCIGADDSGAGHLAIVFHALYVQSVASFPWHVLQLLSVAAGRASVVNGPRCVDIVLVTSISPQQWDEDLQDVEFSDMLTAVGWDAMTLRTGDNCATCTSIGLHVVSSHDTSGSVLRPVDTQRTTWRLIPKYIGIFEKSLEGYTAQRSLRLVFFSPAVDPTSIPWMELLQHAHDNTSHIEAFTIASAGGGSVLSSGVVASLFGGDVVLSLDYAGYNARDVRPAVPGRRLFSAMPDAFAVDVSVVKAHWPRTPIVSTPWDASLSRPSTSPFCIPMHEPFLHFILSCANADITTQSNGLQVEVYDDVLCSRGLDTDPLPDGGVPLASLLDTVGRSKESEVLIPKLTSNISSRRRLQQVLVEWDTFCMSCFGFTNEVMQFLVPLEHRLHVRSLNEPHCFCKGTPKAFQEALIRIAEEKPFKASWRAAKSDSEKVVANASNEALKPLLIHVSHKDPGSFPSFPQSQRPDIVIGRAMYEFTKVPRPWVSHKDQVDEIWVPCRFVKWVFEHAGFPANKLVIIPEPMDVFQYDPAAVDPLVLPPLDRHWNQASNMKPAPVCHGSSASCPSFLSVFKLEDRKGWGELILAYMNAFQRNETVSLYLVTYIYGEPRNAEHVMARIRTFVESSGRHWDDVPHIHVIAEELSELEMMRMYRSVNAFVLATKGEGWGLPAIQAMSMALPTIVSNWSGVVDFASEVNSYLIPVHAEEVPQASPYGWDNGKLWGRPSIDAIAAAMTTIVRDPLAARARGARARRDVIAQFSGEAVAELVAQRIAELEKAFRAPQVEKVNDAIEKLLQDHHLIV